MKNSNDVPSRAVPGRRLDASSPKLIKCPYEVRIDGVARDQFYDLRDAGAFARIAKGKNPAASVLIADTRTGKLVIEVQSIAP